MRLSFANPMNPAMEVIVNSQIRLISRDLQSGRLAAIMKLFGAIVILLAASALPSYAQWTPVWSDEFDGPPGSPNTANWAFETGNNNGWGNNEIEFYCPAGSNTGPCDPSNPNAFVDGNGNLVIRALKSKSGTWTSARMKTQGLQEFQYGRVEARIKLTTGPGLWPAFWMLGTNISTVGWPRCGESDIMEWVLPYGANTTSSTNHGPGYSGGSGIGSRFSFPGGGQVNDADYHTYGVVWSPYQMQFYRDDWTKPFLTVIPSDIPSGSQWVFNHPFFLLLNQAVGGNLPGPPDKPTPTPTPSDMLVDHVRVFKWSGATPSAPRNLHARARASDQIEL
ncbi:MAG TPA: glycoside hydrolase family 16 protein, partial [Terriglobales bacterium]|nr:glycoside hydrolase family 16 protein [Terriglobales bacterium]